MAAEMEAAATAAAMAPAQNADDSEVAGSPEPPTELKLVGSAPLAVPGDSGAVDGGEQQVDAATGQASPEACAVADAPAAGQQGKQQELQQEEPRREQPQQRSQAVQQQHPCQTLTHKQQTQQPLDADIADCLQRVVSYNTARRNNLHLIDDDTLIMAAGSVVLLLHLPSMQQRYLAGRDGGGIAAVAVHPSRQHFLVAEKCRQRPPNIYVYAYPSLALVQTLQHGTEAAYSCAEFSADGAMLASVGGAPDFTLTLWDWRAAATLLRCKAFSQEVYCVRFSPCFAGSLVTSGTGHIRFWRMATTFTGLKLQGQIGKFGSLELSDVSAFVELPDGKVLSSSEAGALLVWDGGLIKAVICQPGGAPCHAGPVEALLLSTATNYLLSGGADGVLRLWDFNKLNEAEPGDGSSSSCEVRPAAEVALHTRGCVRALLWDKRTWLVQMDSGSLLKVLLPINLLDSRGYSVSQVLDLHSGAVLAGFACNDRPEFLTVAADGTLRAICFRSHQVLQQRHFGGQASCAAMMPLAADPAHRTVAVGFADGCVRLAKRCADGWALLEAARPHKVAVACMAFSADGSRLAVVGRDCRVFFFQLAAGKLLPHIAGQLPASNPTCCCWSADGQCLLLGSTSGVAVEVAVPQPGSLDVSRSFEHTVRTRSYTARLPKSQQASAASVLEQQAALLAGDAPAPEIADSTCLQPPAASLPAVASEEEDPFQEAPVLPVTWLSYVGADSSRFRLWLGGQAAGQVVDCSWQSPVPLSSSAAMGSAAVTTVSSSWSGLYCLMGSADGRVRLEGRLPTGKADGRSWQCSLHDMHDGRVQALAMAHDDSCLVSAAADGTLLLLSNPLELAAASSCSSSHAVKPLPTIAQEAVAAGRLVELPDLPAAAPTLEEAKQAAQRNQQAAAAAAAKEQLLAAVAGMQRELAALIAENNARPEGQRVPQHMLELDAGLPALVERERRERLADARAQVAHDAEVVALRLSKLRDYFTGVLAVHHFTLRSLGSDTTVSTFRQAELPPELQLLGIQEAEAEEAEQQLLRQQLLRQQLSSAARRDGTNAAQHAPQHHHGRQGSLGASEGSGPGLPGPSASAVVSRADLWRQAKRNRAAEWAAFNASRPDDAYEAPADVAALAEAAATLGDFKLKSDAGYVLPEDQRMTPARKRRQMLLLMRDMAAARSSFNARVLGLRDRKRALLRKLNGMRSRLAEISSALGSSETLPPLSMQPEEEPEQQLQDVSPAQIAAHKASKKAAADKAAGAAANTGLGGFATAGKGKAGNDGKAASPRSKAPAAAAGHADAASKQQPGAGGSLSGGCDSADGAAGAAAAPLSQAEVTALQFEQHQLQEEVARLSAAFDGQLAACRSARLDLAVDLTAAEGQLLLMLKELAVLKDAEVRELVLEGRRAVKAEEQAELAGRLAEVGRSLDAKRAEGDAAAGRKAGVVAELEVLLAEQDAFRDALSKVFYRKIKRSKKHAGGGGAGDDSSVDGSDDDEPASDDDDCDDGEEEVCPPGCDPGLYEQVVELRERRLDEEEVAGEVGKAVEGIRKERELLGKKAKLLEQSLAAIQQDIVEFQKEKQGRLNQLPAVAHLRLHQVQYLQEQRLPQDLSGALVFSQHQLTRLQQRITELDEERSSLRRQQKELRGQHGQLQADRAAKEARLTELGARCRDVQLLKFGQVIDLSLLDTIGVRNKSADELREQLKQQALAGTRELADWDAKLAAKRRELLLLSRENTASLNTVTSLTKAQRDLEAAVLAGRAALWTDPLEGRRAALAERDNLVATINRQAQALDELRKQTAVLRRKV